MTYLVNRKNREKKWVKSSEVVLSKLLKCIYPLELNLSSWGFGREEAENVKQMFAVGNGCALSSLGLH